MAIYTPIIENEEEGVIIFPPIRQDNTEIYEHNLAQALDELNLDNYKNQPTIILLIGSNDNNELDLAKSEYTDNFFSHTLIRDLFKDPDYMPDFVDFRKNTTYGNTTFIHLTEEKEGKYLYEHNLQISYNLSKYDEDTITYGIGELDEFILPKNVLVSTLREQLNEHYVDENAHENINPYFLVRRSNFHYDLGDRVYPNMTSKPNYLILEAANAGTTSSEKEITIPST